MNASIISFALILFSSMLCAKEVPRTSWFGVGQEINQAVANNNYERLDDIADYYSSNHSKMEYGIPCIYRFYKHIGNAPKANINFFEEWKKQTGSDTAIISQANAYISLAWKARGSGYSNTVSDDGWITFKEKLQKAEEILLNNQSLKKYPSYYSALQSVYHGLAKSSEEYFKLVDEAIARYPRFYTIRYDAIYYLTPRWYGTAELWNNYAEETFNSVPDEDKYKVYARILLFQFTFFDNILIETGASWKRAKTGFKQILKETGNDEFTYAAYTYLACIQGDQKVAQKLFKNKQSEYLKNYSLFNKNEKSYQYWVNWANNTIKE